MNNEEIPADVVNRVLKNNPGEERSLADHLFSNRQDDFGIIG